MGDILLEAAESDSTRPKYFMTNADKYWKKRIIQLLRDDGKGHHYNGYADRLEKFGLNIVPLEGQDPSNPFTAAISYKTGLIYISEGFLDETYLFQLSVLLRHELAHNLLMHEVRMMYKVGKTKYDQYSISNVIQDAFNIIMDDDISNTRYSAEDKETVRHMWLNGQVIGGLVTEDHRASWKDLSLEDMYDALRKEIDDTNRKLVRGAMIDLDPKDPVQNSILRMMIYKDTDSDSIIPGNLTDFLKNGCRVHTSAGTAQWRKEFRELVELMVDNADKDKDGNTLPINKDVLKLQLSTIKDSSPLEEVPLINLNTGKTYASIETPEEKYIAVEVLKKYRTAYDSWYNKVLAYFNEHRWDFTKSQIKELHDMLKG